MKLADKPRITVYLKNWHLTRSDAFHDVLVEPLQPYFDFDLKGWDEISPLYPPIPGMTYIFCQAVPPLTYLSESRIRLIWIPMWDNIRLYTQQWWNDLPKSLSIVAFSEAVAIRAKQANLSILRLHYYKNPDEFEPATWMRKRVLLYWNRMGLVGPDFLACLCDALKIDKLLINPSVDPSYIGFAKYDLPSTLGQTVVQTLPVFATREEYLQATQEANLFIAPRTAEGIGMTFLEALARGNAVFAYNEATMNEYITSGENGYLFKRLWNRKRILRGFQAKLSRFGFVTHPPYNYMLQVEDQDWQKIAALNIQQLGENARSSQKKGYQRWLNQIPQYAQFISDISRS